MEVPILLIIFFYKKIFNFLHFHFHLDQKKPPNKLIFGGGNIYVTYLLSTFAGSLATFLIAVAKCFLAQVSLV